MTDGGCTTLGGGWGRKNQGDLPSDKFQVIVFIKMEKHQFSAKTARTPLQTANFEMVFSARRVFSHQCLSQKIPHQLPIFWPKDFGIFGSR